MNTLRMRTVALLTDFTGIATIHRPFIEFFLKLFQAIITTERRLVVHVNELCLPAAHFAGDREGSAENAPSLLPYPETGVSLVPGHRSFESL